jgi:hypothetical protein
MDNTFPITDEQIEELQLKITEHKKREEYNRLQRDLFEITYRAHNTLNEFDGGMKQVVVDQVLSNKNKKQTFSDVFIARFIKMCSVRPITGNLIAITLAIIAICSLNIFLNNPELKTLKLGLGYFIEFAAGVQILKSASRSLILPIIASIVGAVVANQLTGINYFYNIPQIFMKH